MKNGSGVLLSLLLVLANFLAAPPEARAQDSGSIALGQRIRWHSDLMKEERMLWIYQPDNSSRSLGRYPVLYLLDGDTYFVSTVGVMQFLAQNNRMPQMIVVGIANTDRPRDLTPLPADTSVHGSGGADTFLRCISNEIIPYVDKHYKTAPYRILMGHSFGGIFALNAFLREQDLFGSYIVISPSLWWGKDTLVSQIRKYLQKPSRSKAYVYETVGNEGPRMVPPALDLMQAMDLSRVEGLHWKFKLMETEDHGSIVLKSIYDGLEFVYADWRVREPLTSLGIAGLERHFNSLSDRYGYRIDIPEVMVNNLGYQYLFQNMMDEAIAAFRRNVEHYPGSWNVYDSLGEAYAKKGEKTLAIENYEKSVSIYPASPSGLQALKELRSK